MQFYPRLYFWLGSDLVRFNADLMRFNAVLSSPLFLVRQCLSCFNGRAATGIMMSVSGRTNRGR